MSFHFRETMTLGDARARLFEHYGIAADGGYNDAWVHMKAGPIPIAIPNTASRVRAVKLHDLHHVATEYPTTWRGEAQIGAWELAGGCADHYAAWWLNLGGMMLGLFIAPKLTFRAFVRGRRSRTLYQGDFEESMLSESVGALRRKLGLDGAPGRATAGEVVAFVGMSALAVTSQLAGLALLLSPIWAPLAWLW
jgi:hypothetical protein